MERSKEIVSQLKEDGFDEKQILDAMCDGEFLKSSGIDQETAEVIYHLIRG